MAKIDYKPILKAKNENPPIYIPKEVKDQEKIKTLVLQDFPRQADEAIAAGLPVVYYRGLKNSNDTHLRTLNGKLLQLLQAKEVENLVILHNADLLDLHFNRGQDEDVTGPFRSVYNACKTLRDQVYSNDLPVKFMFSMIKPTIRKAKEVTTLDDLITTEPKDLVNLSFGNIEQGSEYFDTTDLTGGTFGALYKLLHLDSANSFWDFHQDILQEYEFTYGNIRYCKVGPDLEKLHYKDASLYMRVSVGWYKKILQANRYGDLEEVIEPWKIGEINRDHNNNKAFITQIPKYDKFCNKPDNTQEYQRVHTYRQGGQVSQLYNRYHPLSHAPKEGGNWDTIQLFLRHIFQCKNTAGQSLYEFGLDYLQQLYLNPTLRLPILCLVSNERNTGKSTFLKFLKQLFQENCTIVDNERFTGKFTSHFIDKLIVALDEGFIPMEQKIMKERIKSMSTSDSQWLEAKGVNAMEVDSYIKLILCSNDENSFMQIDEGENRFAVLRVPPFLEERPNILDEMREEIPAFLHFLTTRKLEFEHGQGRFSFNPSVYMTETLKNVIDRTKRPIQKAIEEALKDEFLKIQYAELKYEPADLYALCKAKDERFRYNESNINDFVQHDLKIKRKQGYFKTWTTREDEFTGEIMVSVERAKVGRFFTFNLADYVTDQQITEYNQALKEKAADRKRSEYEEEQRQAA